MRFQKMFIRNEDNLNNWRKEKVGGKKEAQQMSNAEERKEIKREKC